MSSVDTSIGSGQDGVHVSSGSADDARVKRRREINRNSQRRIRERRNRELDALKEQADSLSNDNQELRARLAGLTRVRDELMQAVQQLTDKWSAVVAENSAIHKENYELRMSLQQLNGLLGTDEVLDQLAMPPPSPPLLLTALPSIGPASLLGGYTPPPVHST